MHTVSVSLVGLYSRSVPLDSHVEVSPCLLAKASDVAFMSSEMYVEVHVL